VIKKKITISQLVLISIQKLTIISQFSVVTRLSCMGIFRYCIFIERCVSETIYEISHIDTVMTKEHRKAVLLQTKPRDAAVNYY